MAQTHFTPDEWDAYVKANFGTIGDAERWRNANNVFVDNLPNPTYTGPLSGGGSAGARPSPLLNSVVAQTPAAQGPTKVDETNTGTGAPLGGLGSIDYSRKDVGGVLNKVRDYIAQQQAAQKVAEDKAYEAAKANISTQYAGPSTQEQLFALSKALMSPSYVPGFKGFLGNMTNALSDISAAGRTATEKRNAALAALQQAQIAAALGREKLGLTNQVDLAQSFATANKNTGMKYDPNTLTGGYNIRPGEGGMPEQDVDGNWIVTDQSQLDMLRLYAPKGRFITRDDPTHTPRNVS